jgi:AbiV family abortive infection protein
MSIENADKKELKIGISKSIINSKELLNDANLLINNYRFERGYCLSQLAIEESGKASMLLMHLIDVYQGNSVNFKSLAKNIKNHKIKTFESYSLVLLNYCSSLKNGIGSKNEILNLYNEAFFDLNKFNDLKNDSLYVGFKDEKFYSPSEIITKELANEIFKNAQLRINAIEQLFLNSVSYLEILARSLPEVEDILANEILLNEIIKKLN